VGETRACGIGALSTAPSREAIEQRRSARPPAARGGWEVSDDQRLAGSEGVRGGEFAHGQRDPRPQQFSRLTSSKSPVFVNWQRHEFRVQTGFPHDNSTESVEEPKFRCVPVKRRVERGHCTTCSSDGSDQG
jgi:hypothetical protein